ncbi:MAG: response regulator transcription factor [Brasilonema angustatum HA4187-MV1]|jgi:DNA-binding NarL/FixJ family response regulator|nr:response regulator transcription factor [Brasilonema angustatum HA4187-MV1]
MIRLLLVDDQSLVREGIKAMLSLEPDLQVVATADNGAVAIREVEALQPDVVLMDVRMPIMDGKEATRIITQRFPMVKVIVLSTFDDDEYIAQSIQAGARGYLLKDMLSEELAESIRFVHRGYTQLAPGLMEKLITQASSSTSKHRGSTPTVLAELPARERDVLRLIGTGATNREIAQQLFISEGTVKSYVTNLFNRLNLKNRAQLAIYATSIIWDESQNKP